MYRPIQVVLWSGVILCCIRTGAAHDVQTELSQFVNDTVNQVVAVLLPTFKEIQGNINSVRNDFSSFNMIVNNLTEKVSNLEEHQNQLFSKMDQLESKLDSKFKAVESQLEEHKNQTTSELAGLSEMINECLQPNETQPPNNDSLHTCGGTGGWRRVVYLNMTDPNTNCPSGWQLTRHYKRTCGRVSTDRLTCDSVTFPVSGGDYTRMCGRIKGYQYYSTDAFETYHNGEVTTIDGAYVSGVSLTHGSPRQHIWTFAAGRSELHPTSVDACPCDATINITIPPFVDEDYFCESGFNSLPYTGFFPDDPLWDGDGCTASSTCCSFNNPPYFTKQLPSPTTDDIEARICQYNHPYEDTPIELIHLYVK